MPKLLKSICTGSKYMHIDGSMYIAFQYPSTWWWHSHRFAADCSTSNNNNPNGNVLGSWRNKLIFYLETAAVAAMIPVKAQVSTIL